MRLRFLGLLLTTALLTACGSDDDAESTVDSGTASDTGVDSTTDTEVDSSSDTGTPSDSSADDSSAADSAVADSGPDSADSSGEAASEAGIDAGSDTTSDGSSDAASDSADAGAMVTLTIDNYLAWCSIAVNDGTPDSSATQTYTLPAGSTAKLDGAPLTGFIWKRWVGTAGDTTSAHDTATSTTVVMTTDKTVKVCCPFTDGSGCPAGY